MRRLLILIMSLAVLLSGCALRSTGNTTNDDNGTLNFYYILSQDNLLSGEAVIQKEIREVGIQQPFEDILNVYFDGPESAELESPFPTGTSVVSVDRKTDSDEITILLSGSFFTLTSIDFSLACCCIANTVCDCLNVSKVVIEDEAGRISMAIQPDDYITTYAPEVLDEKLYTLYFPDKEYRYLYAETREVNLSENESAEEYLLHELILGPQSAECTALVPEGTRVLSVSTENEVCTVNFNSSVMATDDNFYAAYMLVYGVANTLTSLDTVNYVLFQVEGESLDRLGGLDLSSAIGSYSEAVALHSSSAGQVDINLCVMDSVDGDIYSIPATVKQSVSQPLAEAVVLKAIDFEPPGGMINPIPYGTELLSISVSEGICYVDLSEKFVPVDDSKAAEQAAIFAIVTVLTELDNIDAVLLSVDGETAGFRYVDISKPMTIQDIGLKMNK